MDDGKLRFHCQEKEPKSYYFPSLLSISLSLSVFTCLKQARKSQTQNSNWGFILSLYNRLTGNEKIELIKVQSHLFPISLPASYPYLYV